MNEAPTNWWPELGTIVTVPLTQKSVLVFFSKKLKADKWSLSVDVIDHLAEPGVTTTY